MTIKNGLFGITKGKIVKFQKFSIQSCAKHWPTKHCFTFSQNMFFVLNHTWKFFKLRSGRPCIFRETMQMDPPMATFSKNDGIMSVMHCQEWNILF